jgi:tRNA(Ile)-lysidine synthase
MSSYSQKFLNHVQRFMLKSQLISSHKKVFVAVSGGRDSMCLLYTLFLLKERFPFELQALHVNHGTRQECADEELLVKKFCQKLRVPLHIERLTMNFSKNFEQNARDERYKFFQKVTQGQFPVALAHHINDSMEWSLMNFYKSSNYKAFLGIPLINKNKIRPFLCVTRKQISHFVKINHVPYVDDPSNDNFRFDRNWTRNLMYKLSERFQGGEKHYVYRQNELARQLNLSLLSHSSHAFESKKLPESSEIFMLPPFRDFSGVSERIREEIHRHSNKSRGRLQQQIQKASELIVKGEFGPLHLSGAVKIFGTFHHLLITKNNVAKMDTPMKNPQLAFKSFSLAEFKFKVSQMLHTQSETFPFWVVFQDEISQVIKPQHRIHPYWPELTQSMLDHKLNFLPALRLIELWGKSRYKKKSLNLSIIE